MPDSSWPPQWKILGVKRYEAKPKMSVEVGRFGLGNCLQHLASFGLLSSSIKPHGLFHTGQTQDGTQKQERNNAIKPPD